MQSISNWCDENELILNLGQGKTESMLFGTSRNLSKQPDSLNVSYRYRSIAFTANYKYLEVEINPTLNMNIHVQNSYKRACERLRLLSKIRPLLNSIAAENIYRTTIVPVLTFCSNLYLNLPQHLKKKIEHFHVRASHTIKENSNYSVSTKSPLMQNYFLASLLTKQCLLGNTCSNFTGYFEHLQHQKSTRQNGFSIKLPRVRLEYARNSYYYYGAKVYNEIPLNIRQADSYGKFKHLLKAHLKIIFISY